MVPAVKGVAITHSTVHVDGLGLHCVTAGPIDGPLVVLLHGFPEFWWSWRHQIPALVGAGYRVLVPDMRGYNESDKPQSVSSYSLSVLAEDVRRLILSQGRDKALVVGHDWGGVVAYEFAMHFGDMVQKLAILNVPHPVQMQNGLRTWGQIKKSWYMFFFQLPFLPEYWLKRQDGLFLRRSFGRSMPREEVDAYVKAARKPGALTAMINYYRCSFRNLLTGKIRRAKVIAAPTMVIWGEQDRFLEKAFAVPPQKLVPDIRVEWLPTASHWVQLDAPERVNELLLGFLRN